MARVQLRNEQEVRKYMMGSTSRMEGNISAPLIHALDYTMQRIVERNKELILKIVYNAYSPAEYERTLEFLDSWNYSIEAGTTGGKKATGEFGQDYEEMSINLDKGQHGSPFLNGPDWWYDARDYLADIIYNGHAGKAFGRGPWTRKRDVWKSLMKTVESKIYMWYQRGLEEAGMVVH